MGARSPDSRHQTDAALRRIAALIDASDDAILGKSTDGIIDFWNPGAERIFGYSCDEALGKPFTLVVPDERVPAERALLHRVLRGERIRGYETVRARKDGTLLPVSLDLWPIRDPAAGIVGVGNRTRALTEPFGEEGDGREPADAQREFVALLAHELRSPVNAILGWTTLLLGGLVDPVRTQEALQIIDRNARLQASVINELLDLSRMAGSDVELVLKVVDPRPIVRAAVEAVQLLGAARSVGVDLSVTTEAVSVLADPLRLQQACRSLFSQAVKSVRAGGRLHIRATAETGAFVLRIDGPGSAPASPSVPSSSGPSAAPPTTWPRAIVRTMLEKHGGRISAEAAADSPQSTFVVRLPLSSSPPHAIRPDRPPGPTGLADLEGRLTGRNVLVVDDEQDARELVALVLERAGARVTTADSADSALQAYAHAPPDAIVSDIAMPGTDGYALIRRIRSMEPHGRFTPALALTALAHSYDRQAALDAGFQAHLSKPADPRALPRIVADLITSHRPA